MKLKRPFMKTKKEVIKMDDITTLSDEAIGSYQRIFKEYSGKEISKQDALEQGLRLVNFMKLLIEIDWLNKKSNIEK